MNNNYIRAKIVDHKKLIERQKLFLGQGVVLSELK